MTGRVSCKLTVAVLLLLPGAQASQTQKSAEAKGDSQRAAASKPAEASKPAARAPAQRAVRSPARVPIGQARPTRDRYREIQQALADAGFFPHAVDGFWGKLSEEALKEYQQEEGLNPTGRLDSRTLIRLGLGPQYESPEDGSASTNSPG